MPLLTIAQLRRPMIAGEGVDLVLAMLQSLGFETTGWQDGRVQKSLITLLGTFAADLTEIACATVEYGFNRFSSGDALTEFSLSRFGNTREPGVRTSGPMRLTSTSTSPYTIEVGQLLATDPNGVQFRNTTGGTLAAGSTASPSSLVLQWRSVLEGAATVIARGSALTLVNPLAGVTITNTEQDPWYDVQGKDEESDETLKRRNATQWSRLSVELIAEAYENIALKFGAAKARVDDTNPRGEGTLDVYCAGEGAVLGNSDLAAIQAAIADRAWQTTASWPADADSRVSVLAASAYPLSVTATVYHSASIAGTVIDADVRNALALLVASAPIGGFDFSPGPANVVTVAQILEAITSVDGVLSATLLSPSADQAVDQYAVVTPGTVLLTLQSVAA